ncbi:FAD-binding oxidoreductase [Clostridia bacterium]|nr:FAD-binding oxidoreductase [Clostridia bacterium]
MSQRYDYLIIGAGITGTSLGARLSARGKTVLILDKQGIAGGASGGNLGQISLMDRFEPWHLELAMESLDFYEKLEKKIAIGYRQHGGSILLMKQDQIERAEEVQKIQQPRGLSMELLTPKEAKTLEPRLKKEGLNAMVYCRQEGSVDPLALNFYMADMAVASGAEIRTSECVMELVQSAQGIEKVLTDKGTYTADTVINCAGGWAEQIANLVGDELPIRSHKGTAFVTQPMPKFLTTTLVGGGFLMEDTGGDAEDLRIGTAICQHVNGSIIIGQATEKTMTDDRSIGRVGLGQTAINMMSYFPDLRNVDILRAWAVSTSYSDDGKPVMGYSEKVSNLFTVAGFKGAFTTAPAVADRASRMLLYGEPFVAEAEQGRKRNQE